LRWLIYPVTLIAKGLSKLFDIGALLLLRTALFPDDGRLGLPVRNATAGEAGFVDVECCFHKGAESPTLRCRIAGQTRFCTSRQFGWSEPLVEIRMRPTGASVVDCCDSRKSIDFGGVLR